MKINRSPDHAVQTCLQPIEVDEEWAQKTVACPFCQATVTAPAQSTLTDFDHIPTASPATVPSLTPAHAHPATVKPSTPARNTIAVVALSLTGLLIGLLFIGAIVSSQHEMELTQIQKKFDASDKSTASQMKIFNDLVESYGGVIPSWLMTLVVLQILTIPTLIAATICAIIGLRRAYRRSFAIMSLAICTGMFLLVLTSVLFAM